MAFSKTHLTLHMLFVACLLCFSAQNQLQEVFNAKSAKKRDIEEEEQIDDFCTKEVEENSNKCGLPGIQPDFLNTRIVGGKPAVPLSYPYTVAIFYKTSFHCGGTIISEKLVLTAAHCFYARIKRQHVYVVTGLYNYTKYYGNELRYRVSKIVKHDQFNRRYRTENDIAILKMQYPFLFSCFERRVCLPYDLQISDENCVVVGWGKVAESGPNSEIMLQLQLKIFNQSVCTEAMKPEVIFPGMMCAGELKGGRDACQSDSGGPLMCFHKEKYFLQAIVSFGYGCGRKGKPGVYANVSHYMPWILEKAAELGEPLLSKSEVFQ